MLPVASPSNLGEMSPVGGVHSISFLCLLHQAAFRFKVYERVRHLFPISTLFDRSSLSASELTEMLALNISLFRNFMYSRMNMPGKISNVRPYWVKSIWLVEITAILEMPIKSLDVFFEINRRVEGC